MTIGTTTSVITYLGNGVTTVFTFPFVADQASDLVVTLTSASGVSSVLSPSLYTVVLNAVPAGGLWSIGGTVTYPLVGSAIAAGTFLTIERSVPYVQSVSISNQGAFYPQAVEQALDVLELQLQQLITSDNFSLKFPTSDVNQPNILPGATARAGGTLQFDSHGQPIVTTVTSGSTPGTTATTRKVSTTGTATINVLTSDSFGGVAIYQSSTPVTTVQLPTTGGPYPIFDGGGNAGTSNITVLPPAGKTIDGAASYVMNTNYQSITFSYDGTQVLIGSGSQGLGNNISVPGSISAGTTLSAGTTITAGTNIVSTAGNITASAGNIVDALGNLRTVPVKSVVTSSYTLLSGDAGKFIILGDGAPSANIPGSTFTTGQSIIIYNNLSVGNVTLAQTNGNTMTWAGNNTTGNRTLAKSGMATVFWVSSTASIIFGTGLS